RVGGVVAVGVGVSGGEGGLEADEVVDVEERGVRAAVAVGVADRAGGRQLDDRVDEEGRVVGVVVPRAVGVEEFDVVLVAAGVAGLSAVPVGVDNGLAAGPDEVALVGDVVQADPAAAVHAVE